MTKRKEGLCLGLVGPLPPPSGGMAMQTRQLAQLLTQEGVEVELVQTNAPYQPAIVEKIKLVRALFRLMPYLWRVWRMAGRMDVIHLMANSGWSWQLFSAPVLWLAWLRKTPVIVNYRGGEAREYLQQCSSRIKPSLAKAASIVVPSGFLQEVFGEFAIESQIIPNIVDLEVFHPSIAAVRDDGEYTVVITRNLEPIYGLDTAIRSIAYARISLPNICLKIAGSGPQLDALQQLVTELDLDNCVTFLGRLDRSDIVLLYQAADIMLNSSRVDNMPNSVIESLACGIPVVSTNVGGVPFLVEEGETALLVPPNEPEQMAQALVRLCEDKALQGRLRQAGLKLVSQFAWPEVKDQWLGLYHSQVPTP